MPVRPRRLGRGGALIASLLVLAGAAAAQSPPAALTPDTYATIRRHVDLRPGDLAFQQVPWKSTYFEALVEAQRTEKPIFVWFFFGDPRSMC